MTIIGIVQMDGTKTPNYVVQVSIAFTVNCYGLEHYKIGDKIIKEIEIKPRIVQ